MSTTLFVLVVLQGANGLTFSPGYTTAAECQQQYKGPNVACFAYDEGLTTWTAFFKLPEGGFRTVGKIGSEDECKRSSVHLRTYLHRLPPAAKPVTGTLPAYPTPARPPAQVPPRRLRQTQQALTPNPAIFRSAASNTRR